MAKLNILPAPTFSRLGVNYAERGDVTFEDKSITVPDGSSRQITQFIESDTVTEVTVGKGAHLKLVQVFADKRRRNAVLKTTLADSAELELIQLYIGGDTASEIVTDLNGYCSAFAAHIGFDLGKGGSLDVDLSALHRGRKSTSAIAVSGVLRDDAQKTFKGTIDFRNGASGAKGSEKEEVVLLDENVVNRTVPVILCAEEDVEGSHGATVGRIDERQVYYMRSRGIPEEKIYEMMTRSKLTGIIKKIGDEHTEKRIYGVLGWGDDVE